MRCIYFTGEKCLANTGNANLVYAPTAEEKKDLCENGMAFRTCPRVVELLDYLRASKKE
jgi:hypothetical protein